MDTFAIERVLQSSETTRDRFVGVYPANLLPNNALPRPAILVANVDSDYGPGSHWVCFHLPSYNCGVEFFDSFGVAPCNPNFTRFLSVNGGLIAHNTQCFQSDSSDVCGEFCCTYAYYCSLGLSLSLYSRDFSLRGKNNDFTVVEMFNEMFTCNAHFTRPTLRRIHVQTCSPLCHARGRLCREAQPSTHPTPSKSL
jgi:hypothetical protein